MNAPKLRFVGFNEPWECRAIRDIGTVITGSTPPRCDSSCWGGEFNWISSKDFKSKYIFDSDEKITDKGKKHCRLLPAGSVLVTCIGASIGLKAIAKKPCATNQQINAVICRACDNEYLYYLMGFLKAQLRRCAGQTALPIISKGVFESFEGNFSCVDEQTAISGVLSSFDSLIDAEALRLESLGKLKSACLEKMFTQNDDLQPRLRVGTFKGVWKQCKLGECFEERQERSKNGELLSVSQSLGVIRFSESGRRNTSNVTSGNYKVVCIGDIAYNSMRMWQGASGCSSYKGIVSPAYTVVRPIEGIDSRFAAIVFKTTAMLRKFRVYSQGLTSDTWNLKYPQFAEIEWTIPPTVAEQSAIADYFERLDEAISLQGNRIKRLKNLKSACMERMFV